MRTTMWSAFLLCNLMVIFSRAQLNSIRQRRQEPGQCLTLEGIPGKCSLPESCRFPAAVKVRLFRSPCSTDSGQRGICCPGGTAAAATSSVGNPFQQPFQQSFASFQQQQPQFQQEQRQAPFQQPQQFEQLRQQPPRRQFNRPFFQTAAPRQPFLPNNNGGFLLTSPDDTRSNLPDLAIDDIHTACDESVNCLLTPDRPEPDFFPDGIPTRERIINNQRVVLTPRPFANQGSQGFQPPSNRPNFISKPELPPVRIPDPPRTAPSGLPQQQPKPQPLPPATQTDNPPRQLIIDQVSVTSQPKTEDCPTTPVCFNSKYRTFDGSCNNLNNPNWGKSFFAFPRLIPPVYADGVSAPRMASDGSELPASRLVSGTLIADADLPDNFNTVMIMAFGQFLDHDLTRTAVNKGENNTGIACCRKAMIENPSLRHKECMPIFIPANDPFYSQFNQTCMEFVRSLSAPRPDCRPGPREQMNQITSFIDASNIYGSTKEEADDLRTRSQGKLTVSKINNADMLPFVTTKPDFCSKPDKGLFCFKAGDTRVNEQIGLTVIHTVWLREHNRVAGQLAAINPHWTDDNVYMETRRILGAVLQHIVYNEFLPVLLGRKTMQASDLLLLREGYSFDYDPNVNPAVTNEFATVAYRFGHTLIPGKFMMLDGQGRSSDIQLRKEFNQPFELFKPGGLDGLLRGLSTQRNQQFDHFITEEVTNHLFERTRPFGLDLVAINLQRGRDHGIPGYNRWRSFCGLPRINSFQELTREMDPRYVDILQQLYRNVDDIDLFVAGIAEKPLTGAKLGPSFACIIADQFKRSKKGDRFWYENGFNAPFTPEQLQEIRKVTFARLICDNSDGITQVQQFVFFAPARGNSLMACQGEFLPRMNLEKWANEPVP